MFEIHYVTVRNSMFKNPLGSSLSKKELTRKDGEGYSCWSSACLLNQTIQIDDVDNYYNVSNFKENDYVQFEFNNISCYARVVSVRRGEIGFYLLNEISYKAQQA